MWTAAAAMKLTEATALDKKELKLGSEGRRALSSTSPRSTTADVKCTNGVIHIIDAVLMPPADK